MAEQATSGPQAVAPRIEYRRLEPGKELPADVLFAVEFGLGGPPGPHRAARVRLEPLAGAGLAEVWHATGNLKSGFAGEIRFASDDHHLAGALEVDEDEHGGLASAAAHAYRVITEFQSRSPYRHVLRMWNYFDRINEGEGDEERYRIFCTGRVNGLKAARASPFPAATAIGTRDGRGTLQVYWLAGRYPGIAIDNPRQVEAFNYPRRYGPASPTFSRAMLVAPGLLMISGTASIVGHASRHEGSTQRQLAEIFSNLDSLLVRAHSMDQSLPPRFHHGTMIKAYLRERADAAFVEQELRARLPAGTSFVILAGDVCRADLLLELDCLHAAG